VLGPLKNSFGPKCYTRLRYVVLPTHVSGLDHSKHGGKGRCLPVKGVWLNLDTTRARSQSFLKTSHYIPVLRRGTEGLKLFEKWMWQFYFRWRFALHLRQALRRR